ncbi:MAG: transposase [Planctomycetota bacterium]
MATNQTCRGERPFAPTAKYHRRSIRLKGYDYSQAGAYFITICVKDRKYLLGEVVNGEIILSCIGKIVEKCWVEIPKHFPHVQLDQYVIMPNHIHGIIEILGNCVGVENFQPLQRTNRYQKVIPKSLGSFVRGFKVGVAKWCRQNQYKHFVWQRNYYEHIIRSEDELNSIREYILSNPLQWQFDRENAGRIPDKAYDNQWGCLEETIYGKAEKTITVKLLPLHL